MTRKQSKHSRRVLYNPVDYAIDGARKLDQIHRDKIRKIIENAWAGLLNRENCGPSWADLAHASNMGEQLSNLGICSDADSKNKTWQAQSILAMLAEYASDWQSMVIEDQSQKEMEDAIFIWRIQLDFCSVSEFEKARKAVIQKTEQARKGNFAGSTKIVTVSGT